MSSTFFSSRNLSTAIFFKLKNVGQFDRTFICQAFVSYVQRILQAIPHTADYLLILPTSIHSLAISTKNVLPLSLIEHSTIFCSFAFTQLAKFRFLSIAYSFLYHHHHFYSSNQSYLLGNMFYAIQLIFTSHNCNILQ